MKSHASVGLECPCVPTKMDALMENFLFRVAVFSLSVAGGYYFTRWAYSALHHMPFLSIVAHDKAKPAADALNTLHSGFGD